MLKNLSPKARLTAIIIAGIAGLAIVVWLLILAFRSGSSNVAKDGRASDPADKGNGAVVKEVPDSALTLAQKAVIAWGNYDSFKVDGNCSGSWDKSDLAKAQRAVDVSKYVDASNLYGNDLTTTNLSTNDPMDNDYGNCWRAVVQTYGEPAINSVKSVKFGLDDKATRVATIGVPIKYAITTDIEQGDSGTNGDGGEIPGTGNNFSGTAIVMAQVTLDKVNHTYYPSTNPDASGLMVDPAKQNRQLTVVALPTPTIDLTVVPSTVKLGN